MAFLGIDTGGTFTDFLLLDDDGRLRLHKVLSTPAAPEQAILQGISELGLEADGLRITHGSTVATNAVLEGKGVRTAYLCNQGLADVLTIGRQARRQLYELRPEKQPPLIDPELCVEVDSRLAADGSSLSRLSEDDVAAAVEKLRQLQPSAVAINLLFSFLDDSEERVLEQAIEQAFGSDVFVSRSSDVLPVYKEYERGMTTTLNAMVGPLMQSYLDRLLMGCDGASIEIMQSSAGTASLEHAGKYPVHLLLSGPAGGLLGARSVCEDYGLLTFDMGGTSTDVSIIDGDISFTQGADIAGYPVGVSMIDMHTIGAGGGSIAAVDDGGLLQVGPRSAGADPGPACYGRGGNKATVTDANVVLGRLLPDAFLGGDMALDVEASHRAVRQVADALDLTAEQAAAGIIDVVNDHMVRALRVMSVQRGKDPADYTLVSFGGAGGLHVCALADALRMRRALVPVHAGVLSALGMLAAEQVRERTLTIDRGLDNCDIAELDEAFEKLRSNCRNELLAASVAEDMIGYRASVDLRYQGQSHCLTLDWQSLDDLAESFHQLHEAAHGHRLDMEIELVNLRVRATAESGNAMQLPSWQADDSAAEKNPRTTAAGVPVFARDSLQCRQQLQGPALITEISSTTWVEEGWQVELDDIGNLVLTRVED